MTKLMRVLLILNLELLLVLPSCIPGGQVARTVKSSDQYWTETGLSHKEIENVLKDSVCYSNRDYFLACANALNAMAEKYLLHFTTAGTFEKISDVNIAFHQSEKQAMSQWLPLFEKEEVSMKISFLQAWRTLEQKYVQPNEKAAVIATGINGFLSIYKDPHTYILPYKLYEEVLAKLDSRSTNIGIAIQRFSQSVVVRKVIQGTLADKAGLRRGDRIVSFNGQKITELLPGQISDFLKMKNVERLAVEIQTIDTNGAQAEKVVELAKSEMMIPTVYSRVLNGDKRVGIIHINRFTKNVCDSVRSELLALKKDTLQGLMLDLRDNPGGQVDEAACVAEMFVDKGSLLFETRYLDNSKPVEKYYAKTNAIYKGPLVILINSGSASAAEIVAGSLRDLRRAKLVGERSFGKGSFQDGRLWGANVNVIMFETQGFYYFPSGWTPQLVGLQPDVQASFIEEDHQREEDLFFRPLSPLDSWSGLQSLSWLNEKECVPAQKIWSLDSDISDDPQLIKAQSYLSCGSEVGLNFNPKKGASNGRNGSL